MKADDGMIRLLAAAPSCARKFCLKVSNPNQAVTPRLNQAVTTSPKQASQLLAPHSTLIVQHSCNRHKPRPVLKSINRSLLLLLNLHQSSCSEIVASINFCSMNQMSEFCLKVIIEISHHQQQGNMIVV